MTPSSSCSNRPATTDDDAGSIEALNHDCFCISLDRDELRDALESGIGQPGLFDLVQVRCPHLFATRPVFV